VGYPISASTVLSAYVEISQPATRRQVEQLIQFTECPPDKKRLTDLSEDNLYKKEVLEKRVSILDLLIMFPSCGLPFNSYLELLPPMRVRQYSISSSPLWREDRCTLTFSVVQAPAWSNVGTFKGVATNFLLETKAGSKISVNTRSSNVPFHLPDVLTTPIIMVGAGSGIAPFRGFIQERAAQMISGRQLGDALLFFGCQHPDVDFVYKDELSIWEKAGIVKVRPAFSKYPEAAAKYVQDRLYLDRQEVMELLNKDAKIFVCGNGQLAPAVRTVFMKIYQEALKTTPEEVEKWMNSLERVRYVTDVFS